MRGIALYNKTWECPDCGNNATLAIKKCRKCGRGQPVYGFKDESKVQPVTESPNPTPAKETTSETFFESCLLTKGGKTAADIKKERNND